MARIAYVDHSYHKKTQSTSFLVKLLRDHGHDVTVFWDDAWNMGPAVSFEEVKEHDVVIMFQCCCETSETYFCKLHPNVMFIPMLDQIGLYAGPKRNISTLWERFQGSKMINFSQALHGVATALGIQSHAVRYYQPLEPAISHHEGSLRGFFWLRHECHVTWPMIRALIGSTPFASLHIHLAIDPGSPAPVLPTPEEKARYHITTSTWFADKQDLLDVVSRANVYFAPRLGEGIGQSFLEAMSRGQCVVASDTGTMNEYILHGVNGLLFSPDTPLPLDFSRAAQLGAAARESVQTGYDRWNAQAERLLAFILKPSAALYQGFYIHPQASTNLLACHLQLLRRAVRETRLVRKTERYWLPLWHRCKRFLKARP